MNLAPPEPGLTFAEMLSRATALRPALRERQRACEQQRRIVDATHQDFLAAGFYRVLQPRSFGGYECSMTDFARLIVEVSRGCIDTGWVLSLIASQQPLLCTFPIDAHREAYGSEGDFRAANVLMPRGSAIACEGGFRVQGIWDYCSGCQLATHVLARVLLLDAPNQPKGLAYVLLDRHQFEIVENWDMMGMQGTGSHRIVVAEQTIPTHRLQADSDPWSPRPDADESRAFYCGAPLVGGFASYSVAVGAARGALDLYDEQLRTRRWIAPPFPLRCQIPELQLAFGNAQALIDTAEAALYALADRLTAQGAQCSAEELRRIHRAGLQCIDLAWQAVDLIFRTSGSSSAASNAPLGRIFRGLAVLRTHVGSQPDPVSINVAMMHFSMPPASPL
jgi:3-hydroxy-9,10-secoandrosta-1,3,5(10)-triene-9,17-dione monooxygenase